MTIDWLLTFKTLAIIALSAISPGPDFFMVLRNSLSAGRKAGLATALGVSTGCLFSFSLVIVGLQILLTYQAVQWVLRLACSGYLFYLAYLSLNHSAKPHHLRQDRRVLPTFIYFRQGLLTNVSNPKLYGFCTAILTFTEKQNPSPATNIAIIIGAALITAAWFSMVSLVLNQRRIRDAYFRREPLLNQVLALILIGVGLHILLAH
jgi:threonine/homoserine/homoserine lactone efflux protein